MALFELLLRGQEEFEMDLLISLDQRFGLIQKAQQEYSSVIAGIFQDTPPTGLQTHKSPRRKSTRHQP
jgi:hypothetical protein